MQWFYTARVTNVEDRSSKEKEFTDLNLANKWVRKRSKHKSDMASVTRRLRPADAATAFVYTARVDNIFYGTFQQKEFDDLASAKHFVQAAPSYNMASITRRPRSA